MEANDRGKGAESRAAQISGGAGLGVPEMCSGAAESSAIVAWFPYEGAALEV